MSCYNFIIMKVNGADVSNLPYEDAVQLFLHAEEPIIVEVRRKCLNENNKLSFYNNYDDSHNSPTLAVIASSASAPNNANTPSLCRGNGNDGLHLTDEPKPAISISSISCQTDLSAFDGDSDSKRLLLMKSDNDSNSGIFFRRKLTHSITDVELDTFDEFLKTEFDFEEITLKKSQSAENLGFTISYSTDDFLGSDSGSDEESDGEYTKEKEDRKRDEKEYIFDEKSAPRCKIYVSDIIPNSLADQDGRLRQGDRILQINGQNVLEKVDPDKLLTENKYSVKILVSRYAFGGDDDFLDSAVYCDDKEGQEDKHLSSIYEYEQNTFSSSKSSISKLDQTISTSATASTNANVNTSITATTSNTCQILPSIAKENVCDIFSHANIQVQLETVSKELSLLNSQISVMKQLQTETSSISIEKHQTTSSSSSPQNVKKKTQTLKTFNKSAECKAMTPIKGSPADTEVVEHIYETIPEDVDSDVYYCSPYEGVNERRVEEWLQSIGCSNANIQSGINKSKMEINPAASRLQKPNLVLDDYDNSSSAYNTGGSCSSALLALDQHQSKSTMDYQKDRQNTRTLVSKSLSKTNQSGKYAALINSSQRNNAYRKADISRNEKCQSVSCDSHRIKTPSTIGPFKSPSGPTDAAAAGDSDGHSTLVAKSTVYRMCQTKVIDELKEKDMPGMVWKVKRRPDGTRYIVRRVTKKLHSMIEKNPDDAGMPDSASAIEFDYKRQVNRVKERRSRHKAQAIPSKEKPHSQHWLV